MFVQRIGHLDKTRFGINFKAEDIKCELNLKDVQEKFLKKEMIIKNNLEK
jgi:hypothetical protein